MIFFPSYKMMQEVYEVFEGINCGEMETCMQVSGMKEEEREAVLRAVRSGA